MNEGSILMILAQEEEEVSEVDEGVSVEVVEDDSREKDLNLQSMIQPPNHPPMKVKNRPAEGATFFRGGRGKRQFERHSGTGRPITGEFKRSGGGRANWGELGAEGEDAPEVTGDEGEPLKESTDVNEEKKDEPAVEEPKETDLAEWERQQQQKKVALQDKLKQQQKELRKANDGDNSAFSNLVLHSKKDDVVPQPAATKEAAKDGKKKTDKKKAIPFNEVFSIQSPAKPATSPSRDSYAPRGSFRGGRGGFRGGRGGRGRGEGASVREGASGREAVHQEGKAVDLSDDSSFPSLNPTPQAQQA